MLLLFIGPKAPNHDKLTIFRSSQWRTWFFNLFRIVYLFILDLIVLFFLKEQIEVG